MGSLFRTSFNLLQCTRRMLSSAVPQSSVFGKKDVKVRKTVHLGSMINADLIINEELKKEANIEGNKWAAIREDLLKKFSALSDKNVDSQVYDICFHYDRLDQAISYYKFLESNNYQLNLYVRVTYLKLFHIRNKPITPEEEQEIFRIYDGIRKDYPLMDARACTSCILALSLTKRWQESFQLLDMIKLASKPGSTVVTAIAVASFRNNDPATAWKIINEYVNEIPFRHDLYVEYLNYCKTQFKDDETLQEKIDLMFKFWSDNKITPTEFVIQDYGELYKSLGYTLKGSSVTKYGSCTKCDHLLKQTTLSRADFKMLSSAVLKNLIIGKSVYRSTSPQELKRYMLFVQTMKPYDVVIDGLNVAYAARKHGERGSLANVLQVVNYFTNKRKRVLVIGRAHMVWWSQKDMKELEKSADVFLIKNISQDDPFLLHVTLLSGPDTYFVSRDFMRQHKVKLEDQKLQSLFKNWQLSRQYKYNKVYGDPMIRLRPPLPFDVTAQQDDKGWHIPYTKNTDLETPELYTAPENWICLRKQQS